MAGDPGDLTPYPRALGPAWPEAGNGVHLTKQDDRGGGGFRIVRRLIARGEARRGYHLDVTIWTSPPRKYPPVNAGDAGAGIQLDLEEAAALWASIGAWMVEEAVRLNDAV